MPWITVSWMGMDGLFQTGIHIGGIAYLLLLASATYAVLSWIEQPVPRLVSAFLATLISGLFFLQAGSAVAWGLIGLFLTSVSSTIFAYIDYKSSKQSKN